MKEGPKFRELLDGLFEGVYYVDLHRRVRFWSKGAERITGYSAREVVGSKCSDNILVHVDGSGKNLCCSACPLIETMRSGGHHQAADIFLHHKDGHRVPVSVSVSKIRDARGNPAGAVEIFRKTVEDSFSAEYVAGLRKAAMIDFLTGLPNRRHIEEKLAASIELLKRHGTSFAVFFIDLDHFKKINDTYGHAMGDRVIKMVAGTLKANTRAYNLVGRWGGEEFVAIVNHTSGENARLFAGKLCALVGNSFLNHEGKLIRVTVTLGAALAEKGDTLQSLLGRADRALYEGKRSGRNCVVFEGKIVKPR
ncbi:MAG: sensor domain-containing diguanylate cyclase [Nitrospiraceae bacterium]|nr:sensor domain-containing diguanylate cyclase [Nitrospiraceae bacterium]